MKSTLRPTQFSRAHLVNTSCSVSRNVSKSEPQLSLSQSEKITNYCCTDHNGSCLNNDCSHSVNPDRSDDLWKTKVNTVPSSCLNFKLGQQVFHFHCWGQSLPRGIVVVNGLITGNSFPWHKLLLFHVQASLCLISFVRFTPCRSAAARRAGGPMT